MPRCFVIALGLVFAGTAAGQSQFDALELDVVDKDERPEQALERMATRAKSSDDDDEPERPGLQMDWRLGSVIDERPLPGSVDFLSVSEPGSDSVLNPDPVLTPMEDRVPGHARGHEKENSGRGGGRDKERDREPKDRDRERDRDRDRDDDDDDRGKGRKGDGGKKGRD